MKPEIYVSLDIEADGPVPGLHSMLALGAAAFDEAGQQLDIWYATLYPALGSHPDPDTMRWWDTQPEAREEVRKNRADPAIAIKNFAGWCDGLREQGTLVPVAKPAGFDFGFVAYYLHRYAGRNPLGIACLDLRSYAAGLMGSPQYRPPGQRKFITQAIRESGVKLDGLRPHVAVDDAIEQGRIFMALRRTAKSPGPA